MAPLRWPEDRRRLDFDLLRESPVTLYRSREVLAEHVAWLRLHGYAVHEFDCSGWSSEEDFHEGLYCTSYLSILGQLPSSWKVLASGWNCSDG
jgi:hypothetical protein